MILELAKQIKLGQNFRQFSNVIQDSLKTMGKKVMPKLRAAAVDSMESIKESIAQEAPYRTGKLQQIIRKLPISNVRSRGIRLETFDGKLSVIVLLNKEEEKIIFWVDRGTGIFGPTGNRIVPSTDGGILSFLVGGTRVYARSVEGQRGQKFVGRGIKKAMPAIREKIKAAFS